MSDTSAGALCPCCGERYVGEHICGGSYPRPMHVTQPGFPAPVAFDPDVYRRVEALEKKMTEGDADTRKDSGDAPAAVGTSPSSPRVRVKCGGCGLAGEADDIHTLLDAKNGWMLRCGICVERLVEADMARMVTSPSSPPDADRNAVSEDWPGRALREQKAHHEAVHRAEAAERKLKIAVEALKIVKYECHMDSMLHKFAAEQLRRIEEAK